MSNNAAGSVQAVVLAAKRQQVKKQRQPIKPPGPFLLSSMNLVHASNVSRKKKPISTFLRSVIQATDSTCTGCSAKSAAASQAPGTAQPRQQPPHQQRIGGSGAAG